MDVVTSDTYNRDVVEASEQMPVLVDFWGPNCGPCLKMMPLIEQLSEEHASAVRVVKLNAIEHRRLCIDLGVMGLPTFMLYREGKVVQRLTGDDCTPTAIKRTFVEVSTSPE
jgi:thioredoxin 1